MEASLQLAGDPESCRPLAPGPGRPLAPGPGRRRRRGCSRRHALALCLLLLAALTVASGLAARHVRRLVDAGVLEAAVLDGPGASGYGRFAESYMYSVVTLMNVSNSAEVLQQGAKPKLVEVGPFVYRLYERRKDIVFDTVNDTITYRQHTWIEFDRDETLARSGGAHGSDTDVKVTTLNLVFSGLRTMASPSALHLLGGMLWKSDYARLFEQRTPKEMMEGYNLTFKVLGLPVHTVAFPGIVPSVPVGRDPNMLHRSAIRIGARDGDQAFSYSAWEGQREARVPCPFGTLHLPFSRGCPAGQRPCCGQKEPVPLWGTAPAPGEYDEDANAVRGTTGEQFRRGLTAEAESVELYFSLARRIMRLVTTPGEHREHQGVPVRTFRPDYGTFWANATERPANARYYQWGPSGLLNLTMALGADMYMSPAHFLGCDPSLLEAVEGLRPDPDRHGFLIGVEPTTGITVELRSTVMLSGRAYAEPRAAGHGRDWFPALGGRTLYVPVAWFDVEAPRLPPEIISAFHTMILGQRCELLLGWACIGGAALLTAALVLRTVFCLRSLAGG